LDPMPIHPVRCIRASLPISRLDASAGHDPVVKAANILNPRIHSARTLWKPCFMAFCRGVLGV
jgi:hypothetical protein